MALFAQVQEIFTAEKNRGNPIIHLNLFYISEDFVTPLFKFIPSITH